MSYAPWSWARKLVAAGYQPAAVLQPRTTWIVATDISPADTALADTALADTATTDAVGAADASAADVLPLVAIFCPTVVTSENASDQQEALERLADRVRDLQSARPDRRFVLWLGVQGEALERGECERRVRDASRACAGRGLVFAGFVQDRVGKVPSLNVALKAAARLRASALIQVDDDVYLDAGCLEILLRAYDARSGEAAVGATKIPVRRSMRTSGALRWLRGQTGHACAYPHGCCIALNPHSARFPIPERYNTDDGYICFRWLRPAAADPLCDLMVVPDATCRYFVGGAPGESAWRIRRMLLDIHVLLADFPRATSEYYFRHLLFPGLWPIGIPEPAPARTSPLRWTLRFVYFLMFSAVGVELMVRGLFGRPLKRIHWAGLAQRDAPAPPAAVLP